jgi:hypothetical protein
MRPGFQVSAQPLAAEAANLIENETSALRHLSKSKYRILNIEYRMSNVEVRHSIYFFRISLSAAIPLLIPHSAFPIPNSRGSVFWIKVKSYYSFISNVTRSSL